MRKPTSDKKPIPWLLLGLGLCIPLFLIAMAFLAAKSDAETQKRYQQQRADMAKKYSTAP